MIEFLDRYKPLEIERGSYDAIPRRRATYMRLVILESPFAGDVERNTLYARRALKDSLMRGEAPIASHLLYPQVLDDLIPSERQLGIDAGLAWRKVAEATVVYQDYGISPGMEYGIMLAQERGILIEYRSIGQNGSSDGEPPA
jgi:hypothetical protein